MKRREIICIPFDHLAGWFFQINENKVKREIKERVILYKQKCYKALDDYFNQGYALNEKMLINKPQLREQLVEEIQGLGDNLTIPYGKQEKGYRFAIAKHRDGVSVIFHYVDSLLDLLQLDSYGLKKETVRKKIAALFPLGHPFRIVLQGLGKGRPPFIVSSEGMVDFLKGNPGLTASQENLFNIIDNLTQELEKRRADSQIIYPVGVKSSLVTTLDIVFDYLLENLPQGLESFLNVSNILYIIELNNGNYYIGALTEQTFKERFENHDVVKSEQFKRFFVLFRPSDPQDSVDSFVAEAEIHNLVAKMTKQQPGLIKSAGSQGFKATPNDIIQALYNSQCLDTFELVGPEITKLATEYIRQNGVVGDAG